MPQTYLGDLLRIHIKYFVFREKTGKKDEYLEGDFITVQDILLHLENVYKVDTEPMLVAVNRNVVSREHSLRDGDEVAVFFPVSGG